MRRIAVIDSSALINLVHLDLVSELTLFFDRVYVPRSVHREVNKKHRFKDRLRKLYGHGFADRCMVADDTNVRLLRPLGEGESEAIIQAQENDAQFVILDDQRARAIAGRMGRTPVGTMRVLARLSLEGRAPEVWGLVAILRRDLEFRISDDVVRQAIEAAPEPIW